MESWLPPPPRSSAEAVERIQSSGSSLLDQHGAFDRERAERLAELLRPCWHPEGGTHWLQPVPDRPEAPELATPPAVPSPPLLLPAVLVAGAAACGILVAYASGWVHRLGPIEVSDRRASLPTPAPPAPPPKEAGGADAPASGGPRGLVARAPAVLDAPSVSIPSAPPPRPTAPRAMKPAPPPEVPAPITAKPAPPKPAPSTPPPPKAPPPKPAPENTESPKADESPQAPDIVREAPF